MPTETFEAHVQYDDWKGTAAADDSDQYDAMKLLKESALIKDGEHLEAIEIFSGEVHTRTQDEPVSVEFLIRDLNTHAYRRVDRDMTLPEVFGLFKRFKISISRDGDLSGREIEIAD